MRGILAFKDSIPQLRKVICFYIFQRNLSPLMVGHCNGNKRITIFNRCCRILNIDLSFSLSETMNHVDCSSTSKMFSSQTTIHFMTVRNLLLVNRLVVSEITSRWFLHNKVKPPSAQIVRDNRRKTLNQTYKKCPHHCHSPIYNSIYIEQRQH